MSATLTMTEAHEAFLKAGDQFREAAQRELIERVRRIEPDVARIEVTAILGDDYTEHHIGLRRADGSRIEMVEEFEEALEMGDDWFLTVTEGAALWNDHVTIIVDNR